MPSPASSKPTKTPCHTVGALIHNTTSIATAYHFSLPTLTPASRPPAAVADIETSCSVYAFFAFVRSIKSEYKSADQFCQPSIQAFAVK